MTYDPQMSMRELIEFCQRWKISRLELFGSALRSDFRADSDLDFLVTFTADARWSLLHHFRMKRELEVIVGRAVDLVSRRAIEDSRNWIRRREILSTAKTIYAA